MENSHLHLLATTLLGLIILSAGAARPVAADEAQINERMLFHPSAQQLAMEHKGRVIIYDGVRSSEVHKAMAAQFDRVEHMMFVRTIQTDDSGEPVTDAAGEPVSDDDC